MRDISRVKLCGFSLAADQAANFHAFGKFALEVPSALLAFPCRFGPDLASHERNVAVWLCYGRKEIWRERGRADALHVQR